ncbi:MAG TPA: DUF6364 family protein [Candidatus Cloacimonadota bacterium]|nr:DUF6364 family protein [Candidatus Cloacimonadota bacterium]
MNTKLTLKLDNEVIERAKKYARSQKNSLSKMIETYLKSLINRDDELAEKDEDISPFVKSMKSGVVLPSDYDYKEVYGEYLKEKYK